MQSELRPPHFTLQLSCGCPLEQSIRLGAGLSDGQAEITYCAIIVQGALGSSSHMVAAHPVPTRRSAMLDVKNASGLAGLVYGLHGDGQIA